jgi:hypothetical protein
VGKSAKILVDGLGATAPFHLLHHDFIIGERRNSKSDKLLGGQPRCEARQSRIEFGNALRKTDLASKEAFYYLLGLSLVNFHSP